MLKRIGTGVLVTLSLISMLTLAFNIQPVKTESATIVVPDDYPTIQEAINNANEGDTIYVRNGTYHENVVVNKMITLIGENMNTTIINGYYTYKTSVLSVTADDVRISGFTIRNGWSGLAVYSSNGCVITENIATNNTYRGGGPQIIEGGRGVWLKDSKNCTVANNVIHKNDRNVSLRGANNNTIINNTITNSLISYGVVLESSHNNSISNNVVKHSVYEGIHLAFANNNSIFANFVTNNGDEGIQLGGSNNNIIRNIIENNSGEGIWVDGSNDNIIIGNTLINNKKRGILVWNSAHTIVYHNNFINNSWGQAFSNLINTWDNDYPSGGNYWSDYTGVDLCNGPYQNVSGSDGIGDTAYGIDANNRDNYPLMGTFSSHSVSPRFGEGLTVTMVSNSTISDFTVARIIPIPVINITASSHDLWNETGETRMIMFNLTGDSGLGFCRMCIPKALMCPPYTVALNRGPGSPVYYNETLFNNGTHRWIYFTYPHSLTHEIWIIGKEDITHPLIANVAQHPDKDNVYPDDKVVVYANVTDDLSGVKRVILNFTTNNGTWFSKEMKNMDGDIWNATIPPFPYQTNITHVISAEDNVNNYVTTEGTVHECQYQVIPEFSSFLILPLFLIATLLAVIISKRKHQSESKVRV